MILIIDNYDSFTQNLLQCVGTLKFNVTIRRNDKISLKDIEEIKPTHIILSPGPGHPKNSGICLDIIQYYCNKIPILGVCLGHQSIGHIFECEMKQLNTPMHGKIDYIQHDNQDLFKNIENPFLATRYHSLVIDETKISKNLYITAWTNSGTIMACQHKKYKMLRGIQFHPESLWTDSGKIIIKNFLYS